MQSEDNFQETRTIISTKKSLILKTLERRKLASRIPSIIVAVVVVVVVIWLPIFLVNFETSKLDCRALSVRIPTTSVST